MLRGLDLLAGRGNYRHAMLFYLLVLFGIGIGGISRDHLYIQAHRLAKGDKLGEEKIYHDDWRGPLKRAADNCDRCAGR